MKWNEECRKISSSDKYLLNLFNMQNENCHLEEITTIDTCCSRPTIDHSVVSDQTGGVVSIQMWPVNQI